MGAWRVSEGTVTALRVDINTFDLVTFKLSLFLLTTHHLATFSVSVSMGRLIAAGSAFGRGMMRFVISIFHHSDVRICTFEVADVRAENSRSEHRALRNTCWDIQFR